MLSIPERKKPEDLLFEALMRHVHGCCGGKFTVGRQVSLSHYHADFLIKGTIRNEVIAIDVECDGHDFHEKTKEQAEKDKRRDGVFQACGVMVRRFTGSQIYRSPDDCALLVRAMIARAQDRIEEKEIPTEVLAALERRVQERIRQRMRERGAQRARA